MALDLSPEAAAFLGGRHVMTLATHGSDGPWAAALFYVPDGDGLVFLSAPDSRHGRDLARHPACAATIQDQEEDWTRIAGIQLEGRAAPLEGAARDEAQRLYAQRFAFVRPGRMLPAIARAIARVQWYRLAIDRLRYIDNRRGLGHRETFGG